jgi:hypothetical protein
MFLPYRRPTLPTFLRRLRRTKASCRDAVPPVEEFLLVFRRLPGIAALHGALKKPLGLERWAFQEN